MTGFQRVRPKARDRGWQDARVAGILAMGQRGTGRLRMGLIDTAVRASTDNLGWVDFPA
jgi:hypothetical protein